MELRLKGNEKEPASDGDGIIQITFLAPSSRVQIRFRGSECRLCELMHSFLFSLLPSSDCPLLRLWLW
jgi:hypothetical protein